MREEMNLLSNGASLSVLGLYNWDNSLFDGLAVPDGFDTSAKDLLVSNLVLECAELEVIYSDWGFLKQAIAIWSEKELPTWDRLYKAMLIEYNPIENYNRVEKTNTQNRGAFTHSGTDSVVGSGNDSDVTSGGDSVTNSVTSFDSNTLLTHDKAQESKNTTITHNKGSTEKTTYGHTVTDNTGSLVQSEISGNIGVTTSQQMLSSELELAPKLNVMNTIIRSFKERFCILVY